MPPITAIRENVTPAAVSACWKGTTTSAITVVAFGTGMLVPTKFSTSTPSSRGRVCVIAARVAAASANVVVSPKLTQMPAVSFCASAAVTNVCRNVAASTGSVPAVSLKIRLVITVPMP